MIKGESKASVFVIVKKKNEIFNIRKSHFSKSQYSLSSEENKIPEATSQYKKLNFIKFNFSSKLLLLCLSSTSCPELLHVTVCFCIKGMGHEGFFTRAVY